MKEDQEALENIRWNNVKTCIDNTFKAKVLVDHLTMYENILQYCKNDDIVWLNEDVTGEELDIIKESIGDKLEELITDIKCDMLLKIKETQSELLELFNLK
jgi:hypothetical protein